MNKVRKIKQALVGLIGLLTSVAMADVSPWNKDDGEWITISGKVVEVAPHSFKLDYGKGAVTVEMDDYDKDAEGYLIKDNDKVVVTGRVDADRHQKRSIEAGSVYVKGIKRSFFANSDDDEQVLANLRKAKTPLIVLNGKITMIDGDVMIVESPYQSFGVNVSLLPEPAFDEAGLIQLEVGERVSVYGAANDGFFDGSSLKAVTIVERQVD